MKGSHSIVVQLKCFDVRYVFGLPGDTSMSFYAALAQARDQITHILVREERAAGFMADGYARVSGRVGVCEAPSGAGATYLAPGVAEAHASSIPVIALTSDTPLRGEGKNVLTALDQNGVFEPITKARFQIKRAELIPETFRRAFRIATSGRPGAIHISLPEDILHEDAGNAMVYAEDECKTFPAFRARANPSHIRRAADLLLRAQHPVIIAGGGVVTSGAWQELTALAESLQVPVATTIVGKGSIDEGHPLSIGVIGGNGGRDYANQFVVNADLIFYIGANTDSVTTMNWTCPTPSSGKTIIQCDVDPTEIGNNYPVAAGLAGDAKLVLADLLEAVKETGTPVALSPQQRETLDRGAELWWSAFQHKAAQHTMPFKPQHVIAALAEVLPEDSIVVADAGTPTPFMSAYFRSRAGRRVIIPRGYGGLGYALPAAMGAKLASPESTVVALMGDGSFGMTVGEFETLHRLGLPITVIQFSNGEFGWLKILQKLYYEKNFYQVDFSTDTDYVGIARGFGVKSMRVDSPGELTGILRAAVRSQEANFIDLAVEPERVETPPVTKWQTQGR